MFAYREEIDGLRSIAVIPVILYHAGFTKFFAGGYIGVDIFFVISGYLITSVIEHECEQERFSIINFYERRCRRILPALFFIICLSSLGAYYLMLPEELKEYGETVISILCLSSNVFFWYKNDGYFSEINELNPLVHTWSLAVEEQFYFIFPILCYLLRKRKRCLIIVLIICAGISFFLCQWGGNLPLIFNHQFYMFSQPHYASFYLPTGRIWELLFGAFIAFFLRTHDLTEKTYRIVNEFFSIIGLALIIVSVIFLNSHRIPSFPNCYTLLPTVGASLIILFGQKNTLVGYLLSTRLLRFIGLISYSIYLWHQPLLAFLRLQSNRTPEIFIITIVIITVFLLSIFTYFCVEQPFRNKTRFTRKQIFSMAGVGSILILILALGLIQTANSRTAIAGNDGDTYLSDLRKYGNWQYVVRDFNQLAKRKTFSNESNTKLVLIGDSFAQDFYNIIVEGKYLSSYDIRVYYIYSRCQIYLGSQNRKQFIDVQHHQTCANDNDIKLALPLIRQANVILLVNNWYEWSARRLPMTIRLLNLTKQQEIFIVGPKHFGKVNPKLYINKTMEYRIKQFQHPKAETIKVNDLLERTIDPSMYVNVLRMICNGYNHTCPLFTREGKLISHDGAHLTKYGVIYVGNIIFQNKPLNRL
ncbi:unnamed protein product [Adineta ricciae]|uniref:Acyltransferase n=1 Tax=Adineta ricciae TaxID=249248 RepID=A0A815YYN7_ADIRI|nr:unnamed protein product [Adineta ricciae]CAF1576358.1 unnamed protein product [Adineta ricciae]